MPTIWFEVEDVVRYFDGGRQVTGVPRVCLEIMNAAFELYPGRVRFCRLSRFSNRLEPIAYAELTRLCSSGARSQSSLREKGGRFNYREIKRGLRYLWRFGTTALNDYRRLFGRRPASEILFRRGDILVCIGPSWESDRYGAAIAEAKARCGIRFVALVHDIIPLTHPDYCISNSISQFRHWLEGLIANADLLLTSSAYGRDRLIEYGQRAELRVPPIDIVPFGSVSAPPPSVHAPRAREWPDRFVLFVSTVEIRKNHGLLLAVWRRLIRNHGPDAVPALICVGREGWQVDNLLADLKASRFLDGKIIMTGSLADDMVTDLYRRTLFSVFPSFCEGWGLPVAESLSHGVFCVCSNVTAIPEVGGDFVDYFDPCDEASAYAAIKRAIFDPAYLARRTADLRARYRPRSWSDCVRTMIYKIDGLASPAGNQSARAEEDRR